MTPEEVSKEFRRYKRRLREEKLRKEHFECMQKLRDGISYLYDDFSGPITYVTQTNTGRRVTVTVTPSDY